MIVYLLIEHWYEWNEYDHCQKSKIVEVFALPERAVKVHQEHIKKKAQNCWYTLEVKEVDG